MSDVENRTEAVAWTCSWCGARQRAGRCYCWLCSTAYDPESSIAAEAFDGAAGRPYRFTLTSLFLIITLIALILGLARSAPYLAIALATISLPALNIAMGRAERRAAVGQPMSTGEKIGSFFIGVVIAIGILVALAAACLVSCGLSPSPPP